MDLKLFQAFLIATIAGFALALGGVLSLVVRYNKKGILPLVLSFTGGIMLYVAFVKLFPSAITNLSYFHTPVTAFRLSSISFFFGLLITTPIDMILAYFQRKFLIQKTVPIKKKKFLVHELFFLIFLSITIHNFVEGIATFLTYFSEKEIAIPVLLSMIAHNIPEGAVITMIIYKRTQNKNKSILFCLITSLAEPLGALCTYLFLQEVLIPAYLGIVKAFLAGLLVNTALDELIPGAHLKGNHKLSMKGIIGGMLFMGILLMISY